MARRPRELEAEALRVIARGQHGDKLYVAAVAGAGVDMEQPRRFRGAFRDKFFEHIRPSLQTVPREDKAYQRKSGDDGPVVFKYLLDLEPRGDGVDEGDRHGCQNHAEREHDDAVNDEQSRADAAEEQRDEHRGERQHLDRVAELEYAQRRAAVLGQQTFAYLGLGFGGIKGVIAGLAGDGHQKRDGRRNHRGVQYQAAVMYLVLRDLRHGEREPGSHRIADSLADGEQHQHERKLAGDDRDHLAGEPEAAPPIIVAMAGMSSR